MTEKLPPAELKPGPLAIFDKATQTITQERGAIYGHPADDFGRLSKMAEGIADCKDETIRHALYMILAKVARLAHTPDHLDSWIDIAGYARTGVMVLDRRAKER